MCDVLNIVALSILLYYRQYHKSREILNASESVCKELLFPEISILISHPQVTKNPIALWKATKNSI